MRPMNEMTYKRAEVLKELSSYGPMLLEHLVKVFYHFDSEENIKGWCRVIVPKFGAPELSYLEILGLYWLVSCMTKKIL